MSDFGATAKISYIPNIDQTIGILPYLNKSDWTTHPLFTSYSVGDTDIGRVSYYLNRPDWTDDSWYIITPVNGVCIAKNVTVRCLTDADHETAQGVQTCNPVTPRLDIFITNPFSICTGGDSTGDSTVIYVDITGGYPIIGGSHIIQVSGIT